MKLESIIPWGRSLNEYRSMFSLTEIDLNKKILGCGDGPASFNAEITAAGGSVISVDPIYQFTGPQIHSQIDHAYDQIMSQIEENFDKYTWDSIDSIEQLGKLRMNAMEIFLSDFESGSNEGRYVSERLPELPFEDNEFELALCSHFLFLYSEQVNLDLHIGGMRELCRVAKEVRVYPLLALDGKISSHIQPVKDALTKSGMHVSMVPVEYRFQKGAVEMLVAKNTA